MDYAVSKARLINYFSTVTYIDDKFDHCIIDEPIDYGNEEIEDTPPLPVTDFSGGPVDAGIPGIDTHTEEEDSEFNLSTILTALNSDKYAGVRFTPVLFKDNIDKDILVRKIQESPLTLIDWNLGAREKAFDFINQLFDTTKQLKVIVVYTSNYEEAITAMQQDQNLKNCPPIIADNGKFACFRCNHQSLLAIAGKQSYNLEKILDIISDIFIDKCGLMPVAVLDYMASAQRVSDELFGSFCHPFEDIYWLQMYFSELSEADIPATIVEFIQNKICEACSIESNISNEMFAHYKNRLKAIMEMCDKEATEFFHQALNSIRPHLQGSNTTICDTLLDIDYSVIKDACNAAITDSKTWRELIEKFSSVLMNVKNIIAKQKLDSLFAPFSDLQIPEELTGRISEHREKVYQSLMKQVEAECISFGSEIFPVLLQILVSSPEILYSGVELVRNLKYRNYDNVNLNEILADGKDLKSNEKANYLRNKFHFGDILIRKVEKTSEYLLCISPPCDVCRPDKVKLNICFIKGIEIPEHELNVRRKENVHISTLPINEDGQEYLRYVAWRLFDVVKFDLSKKDEYEKICTYTRPFMMSEQYSRQIGNLFTSYFSRAGVDELFMKSEGNLRAIFSLKPKAQE